MKIHKSIKLEEELVNKIHALAKKDQRTFNNMIEVLLTAAVKK